MIWDWLDTMPLLAFATLVLCGWVLLTVAMFALRRP